MTIREKAQEVIDAYEPKYPSHEEGESAQTAWVERRHAAMEALRAELAKDEWQPIETAPKGRKLIVGYLNRANRWRTVMGCYYEPETLESEETESGWAEAGWYEESDTYDVIMPCDCEPTHWMPLPAPPLAARETP